MAYPDYGAFLPTEALFTEPGAYAGVLKAEAQKRAAYLSSMDQFYAQLTESARQFNEQYTLAEKEFGLKAEEALWQREFSEKSFESQQELFEKQLILQEKGIDIQQSLGLGAQSIQKGGLDVQREQLRMQEKQLEKQLSGEEEFTLAADFFKETYGKQDVQTRPIRQTSSEIVLPIHPADEYEGGWTAWLDKEYKKEYGTE